MSKTSSPAYAEDDNRPSICIETVRVVREYEHHKIGAGPGPTVGQLVDSQIAQAIQDRAELLDIAVHFEREVWEAYTKSL